MAQIEVLKRDAGTFEVTVTGNPPTVHVVTLNDDYYQKLTGGKVTPENLVARSFEFLLERENNTAILRRFELQVIGRYFPEYEKTISERL